jgi:hypothetical protein
MIWSKTLGTLVTGRCKTNGDEVGGRGEYTVVYMYRQSEFDDALLLTRPAASVDIIIAKESQSTANNDLLCRTGIIYAIREPRRRSTHKDTPHPTSDQCKHNQPTHIPHSTVARDSKQESELCLERDRETVKGSSRYLVLAFCLPKIYTTHFTHVYVTWIHHYSRHRAH